MITSVTFDDTIPYAVDRRESRFDAADGWAILEEQPGRIRLRRDSVDVVVQAMPYTITSKPDAPIDLTDFPDISEASLGNHEMSAERALASAAEASKNQKKRGR